MSYDIRAAVAPHLDAAVATVMHPDERISWDIVPMVGVNAAGQPAQVIYYIRLVMPSPVLGRVLASMKVADLLRVDGPSALELARELVENLRSVKAQEMRVAAAPPASSP